MPKMLYLTPEVLEQARKEFEEALSKAKFADGKVTFTKTFDLPKERKAKVFFSEKAYTKMLYLIVSNDKEVAWHGVARRCEDPEKDEYMIDDIMVYPQEVTGATVNTDQEKYQTWLWSFDDEIFNNIRMQGHSHVNMSCGPSAVDLTHQESILAQMKADDFYIFMIWNKSLSKNIRIYDMKKNIFFDTADCEIAVIPGEYGIGDFLKESEKMVTQKYSTYNGYSGSYSGYKSYGGKTYSGYNPVQSQLPPAEPKKSTCPKEKKKDVIPPKSAAQTSLYDYEDEMDPYSAFGYREY